jgi:hypothetical protein
VTSKTFARCFAVASLAAAFWGYAYPRPYGLCMVILIALPWLALLAIALATNKASFAMPIIFPSIVLGYRVFHDFQLLSWDRAAMLAAALTAVFLVVAALASRGLRTNWGWLLLMFPFLAVTFGYGAVLELNALLASAPQTHFSAPIMKRDRHRGRRYTFYSVELGPWGIKPQAESQLVAAEVYYALSDKTVACVDLATGAFGIQYYQVRACASPSLR